MIRLMSIKAYAAAGAPDKAWVCVTIAACMPMTTASWPMYRWQKPPIRPMP